MKILVRPKVGQLLPQLDDRASVAGVLGLLALVPAAVVLVGAGRLGTSAPLPAFVMLGAVGLTACAVGIGCCVDRLGWLSPVNIAGSFLGVLALGLLLHSAMGWPTPFLPDERARLAALAGIVVIKWLLSWLHLVGRWRAQPQA